jgi:hypothetical protein
MVISNVCNLIPLLQLMHCLISAWLQYQLFSSSMSICHKQTIPASKILLPLCVLLCIGYCLVRTDIAKCFTNKSKRFLYEAMFENEKNVLLVNEQFSHLLGYCASGLSSGLANKGDFDWSIPGGRFRHSFTRC